ncbi:MAG: cation-transporting P-type ATPase [Gammaproteobacteria bacterium]|nr:cation-transporting P-type ATPase [Gammaproteobacteria bacterium]MBU1723439.1 cation-transporting P-type ATPase [Gammaproteobacteria bacterium]MBU2003768.1 cation-transporting P-type ATPase [Gammaproteobacteria bacterium]
MTNKHTAPPTWHTLDAQATLQQLASTPNGLDSAAAEYRLQQYGANRIQMAKPRSALQRFLSQFHNILIYILLAAAVSTALLEHWIDTGVILGVVLINALIGFIQEGKAESAINAIRQLLSPQASVRRDGRLIQMDAALLVPGDIVSLQSGDKVPADLRLLTVKDLRVDESLLTGESVPVDKHNRPVATDTPIAERSCMAWSGTLVTYGQASGVVTATGQATEIGHISTLLGKVEKLETPLMRQLARFGQQLTIAILLIAIATFLFGVLVHGDSPTDMLLAAVGLAVAAIPEGLPAIMTIALAIGVQRMAKRNAIIRLLPAVETLGSVTVICTDKTGTLTRNEMTVQNVVTASATISVSGVGYAPHGEFRNTGQSIQPEDCPVLLEIARAALLCNDAELHQTDGRWQVSGDPTEGALITLALKAGLEARQQQHLFPRTDVIPFESQHQLMASLHHDHAGHAFIYVKGAPERLLGMCQQQRQHDLDLPIASDFWETRIHWLADQGQRVLALAAKRVPPSKRELDFTDLQDGFTLLGLAGMIDPPGEAAFDAVAQCHAAGIRVQMITGDHAVTAQAIARSLNIAATEVFARATPEDKLLRVESLQASGEVIAMTGDGVNDAPALRRADVGIAMGKRGTEVAKEAAEIVLADDDFASITHAVEEGRTVHDNLKKAILFILPTSFGEALIVIAAVLAGYMLPITPVQILWINMVTTVTLALTLAVEPAETRVMQRPPRDPQEPLLSRMLMWRILFVSLIMLAGTFSLFVLALQSGASLETARTLAVNTVVLFQIFYLLTARYLTASVLNWQGLTGNPMIWWASALLLLLQMAFTYLPPMQALFHTAALATNHWLWIIAVASSVFLLIELEKWLVRLYAANK